MKRTPLKRKSYPKKNYPWKRVSKKGLFAQKESKQEEWARILKELKKRFVKAGIVSCELKLEGCTRAYMFGWSWCFAHSLKRDQISPVPELRFMQIREVVYACGNCHAIIEDWGNKHNKMYDCVRGVIVARKVQP